MTEWKKWLAVGTGIGIEIGSEDLTAVVARVRPSGIKVLGSLAISRFREQPAAEWGSVYSSFLGRAGHGHVAATVLLPREEVVVRQVQLPGVADSDIPAALRFQIDSLHPFGEDEAAYDWARVGKTTTLLVGIARRSVIEQYVALFAEAGIKIHAFTFSAASLYSAVRVLSTPPSGGFLALGEEAGELETYGESPAHPVFSARLNPPLERARSLALSELRLPPETETTALSGILPKPAAVPEDYDVVRGALTYATAVSSACPWLSLRINLLPASQREASSRLLYVPTIVLGALVFLMSGALMAYSGYEDRRYLVKLQAEIQKLQPAAQKASALDRQVATTRNRAQALDNFRRRLKDDMGALNDLSNVIAPPAWLTSLQLTRDSMSMSGEAERAEALLKLLDNSRQFRRSEFTLPIARGAGGESFSIHSVREGVTP
ncbi:MAG: PilN domain-containing protein [Bryobacteraceae bacterium]